MLAILYLHSRRFLIWALSALFVVLFFLGDIKSAPSQPAVETNLPTRILQTSGTDSTNALLPEWSQISLGSLPPINSGGSVNVAGVSRSWTTGQTPDQFLSLGDISQALRSELLPVSEVGKKTNLDVKSIALSAFPLVGEQTLNQLVESVSSLGQVKAANIPPVAALLATKGLTNSLNLPIATILNQFPQVGNSKLKEIDLQQFPLSSIPNLDATPLQQFNGWQNAVVKDIPGLANLALSQFPTPVAELGGVVMRVDAIYGSAESKRQNTISGSDVVGFNKGCGQNCAYIELDDLENVGRQARGSLEGKQWISGKYQQVEGGWGCLKGANGGKEPTGRLPFGSAFKVVVMEPNEKTDTVDTALYFRLQAFCGATPYFVGPVPFFSYRVNAPIFVGLLNSNAAAAVSVPNNSLPAPTSTATATNSLNKNIQSNSVATSANVVPSVGLVQGVNVDTLAQTTSSLESGGNYNVVGPYVCADNGNNCGYALGKYQYMSYNDTVKNLIASKPGGNDFLLKLKSKGYQPTDAEIFQYFPPADQESIFKRDLANSLATVSTEVDPTTGQLFEGDGLIERVAQKHFGGNYSKVDGDGSDAFGRYTIKSYGKEVLKRYKAQGV